MIAMPFMPLFMLEIPALLDLVFPQLLAITVLPPFFPLVLSEGATFGAFVRSLRIVASVTVGWASITVTAGIGPIVSRLAVTIRRRIVAAITNSDPYGETRLGEHRTAGQKR